MLTIYLCCLNHILLNYFNAILKEFYRIDHRYGKQPAKKASYKREDQYEDINEFNKRLVDPEYSESAVDILGGSKRKQKRINSNKYIEKFISSKPNVSTYVDRNEFRRSRERDVDDHYYHVKSQPKFRPDYRSRCVHDTDFNYKTKPGSQFSEEPTTYDIEEKLNDLSNSQNTSMYSHNFLKSPLVEKHQHQRNKVYKDHDKTLVSSYEQLASRDPVESIEK